MKILFIGKNHSHALRDSDPRSFKSVARTQGHSIAESLSDLPDIVICVDFEKGVLSTVEAARKISIPSVLIAHEPAVVIPQHSKASVRRLFDKVIEVGRPDSVPVLKWPQLWVDPNLNSQRLDRAVVVNADKWSFVKGQLYCLRAAVISRGQNIDTYGHGWDRPTGVRLAHLMFNFFRAISSFSLPSLKGVRFALSSPMSFRGVAVDKIQVMSEYKVALVIENSEELMTEKLFDSWFAGCIPVYVGPDLEPFGIPSSLFIRCKSPTAEEVSARIAEALKVDHRGFLRNVQLFLADSGTKDWAAPFASQKVLETAIEAVETP
jgi:hypothetical protein